MENKTISYLNSKVWYRSLKVIFILSFILAIIFPLIGVYFEYKPEFDNKKSYVVCKDGRTVSLEDNNIYLYSSYVGGDDDLTIKKRCTAALTFDEFKKDLSDYASIERLLENRSDGFDVDNAIKAGYSKEEVQKYLEKTINKTEYKLVSIYTPIHWVAVVGYSFLIILSVIVFFEIIKRIFYYIVLGVIKPKK